MNKNFVKISIVTSVVYGLINLNFLYLRIFTETKVMNYLFGILVFIFWIACPIILLYWMSILFRWIKLKKYLQLMLGFLSISFYILYGLGFFISPFTFQSIFVFRIDLGLLLIITAFISALSSIILLRMKNIDNIDKSSK